MVAARNVLNLRLPDTYSVGLLIATYFIGGAFYNYKQYNARGLDLIPHRGRPFIFQDAERKG
jgi:hypothetical protein